MSRQLVGVFDRGARPDSSRLIGALGAEDALRLDCGQLQIACSGPEPPPGPLLCLFDGFLDNAVELAESLGVERAGIEQLLSAGYRRWGRALPERLRGDFALVIWDRDQREGLIARDQLGVRSIYLHERSGRLSFAGEIHQLLALLPSRPAPDPVSVAHWVAVSNRPGPHTLYTGIRRLNPGSMLVLDSHGAREERYWEPRYVEPLKLSLDQLGEQVRASLERAVRRRVDPAGQTAVLMSGGLDSAAVAAVAARQAPGCVSSYSGVFPEHPAVDESYLIEELREALALPGTTAEVRAGGLLASMLESLEAWQVPLLGWGDFWMMPLLRTAAAAGVTTTIGGDGGDELFGPRVYLLADRLRALRPREALALALEVPGAGDRPPRRQVARALASWALAGAMPHAADGLARRGLAGGGLPRWLRRETARNLLASDDPSAWKRLDGPRWWAHTAHGLTRGVEETGVFEHQRRRAALAGLQARHPLFDLDLLELALRQPPESSFDRQRNRPVLRASMTGLLPVSVRLRPTKAWFDSLIIDCLTGPDGTAVRELITGRDSELRAYVEPDGLWRALFDTSTNNPPHSFRWMHQVWRLVNAECWLRSQAGDGLRIDLAKASAARVRIRSDAAPSADAPPAYASS